HPWEAWSDARAYDGTMSIIQPLIEPLYGGKSAHEILAAFLGQPEQLSHDIVQGYWKGLGLAQDFETAWRKALHDGLIVESALPPKQVKLQANFDSPGKPAQTSPGDLEINFRPDPTIWDGRFANNGWLQELPKPLLLTTWDNVALLSPATAQRLQLANEQVVELRYKGRKVNAPIWILPGHADDAVTVFLGYGRT